MNGDEIAPPRVTGRQQNCTNVPAASAHEYCRRAVFLPFVDICMAQLHERFQGNSAFVNRFTLLLPTFCNRASILEAEELTQLYSSFLHEGVTVTVLETELLRWKSYWQRQGEKNDLVTLWKPCALHLTWARIQRWSFCSEYSQLSPSQLLLRNAHSATSSSLKITWDQHTMTENRLNGLSQLFINRYIKLDYNKVIDQFGGEHNRRLKFTWTAAVYDVSLWPQATDLSFTKLRCETSN
jgi:hypothetical protein